MYDRTSVNFAQAEGFEPLPSQLQLRVISSELSARLWSVTHASLSESISHMRGAPLILVLGWPWDIILENWWVNRLFKNIDEFPRVDVIKLNVKEVVTSRNYILVFDFIQFVIRHPDCPLDYGREIAAALEVSRAAYRLVDQTIVPISSDEAGAAVERAMLTAKEAKAKGPHAHLRAAAEALSIGKWAESIRESVHAVEATAKSIEPNADTLGPALKKLQVSIALNPALQRAFSALYGYSSDEKGIRHSLVFGEEANVRERDALFMLGACAAFVDYLLSSLE